MSKPWRLQAASFSRTEAFQGMIRSDPAAAAVKSFMRRNMRQSAQSLFTVRRRRTGRSNGTASPNFCLIPLGPAIWASRPVKLVWNPKRKMRERSEEHTSELQSLMRTSYAVFCLKKQTISAQDHHTHSHISIHSQYTPLTTR